MQLMAKKLIQKFGFKPRLIKDNEIGSDELVNLSCGQLGFKSVHAIAIKNKFIKERIVETRAFEGCQKCEIAASKEESDIIIYEIWDTFDDQKKYVEWRTETGVLEETLKFMDSEPRFFQYDHIGSY